MRLLQKIYRRYIHNVGIAVEAIWANKLKSMLTALGIMFGVAAVISMLAIGKGAQLEVLEQIKQVGVNNIIVSPSAQSLLAPENQGTEGESRRRFSRGLTLLDAQSIAQVIPAVKRITPVISMSNYAIFQGKNYPVILEGVDPDFFELLNVSLAAGTLFTQTQCENAMAVCVVGDNIRRRFFADNNPIGQHIKCGQVWLRIAGVAQRRDFTASASDEMGISSTDNKIFVPAATMLLRFNDRARVSSEVLESIARSGSGAASGSAADQYLPSRNQTTNQLDKIIVQVHETEQLQPVAEIIRRMLLRRHSGLYDFEVTVPELLLKQQQKTNYIFHIVLGAIAGISLIVGGIGIMNIMLASVWERIREIGTRQAVGASRTDIVVQFLAESTLISLAGGVLGIFMGIALALLIEQLAGIQTIVSVLSVWVAFGVSASVGILFGYLPAKKAASQDPVESLRQ